MELALYHPQYGYYASGRAAIGRHGDFFTNVSVGPLFGKLLAVQFAEIWEHLGKPPAFSIVEQGAHHGDFARDVLTASRLDAPEFFDALRYVLVEPVETLRTRQEATLGGLVKAKVVWRDSLTALDPFCGVHFSNELLDAMPVHLVVFREGAWQERCVDFRGGCFVFVDRMLSNQTLRAQLQTSPPPSVEGFTTEVNLDVRPWLETLATKLQRGYLLAIDYGHAREIFHDLSHAAGTLACYSAHRRSHDPLQAVGHADITAHVEFTSVVEHAESLGFTLAGFTDQHHFMVGLGARLFRDDDDQSPGRQHEIRAYQTLMHPGLMGQSFKALALQRNVAPGLPLSGFRFGRNPRAELGLT